MGILARLRGDAPQALRDVLLTPSPTAAVWPGLGQPFEFLATPGVTLAPGDVLVEVELATVCGSDVHTVLGHRAAEVPLVLGHEQVGRVVAFGETAHAANGTPLMVGMRVIWSVAVSCGSCDRCRRGLGQKCRALSKYGHERVRRGWELSGGFASHVKVLAGSAIVIVDDDLPATVAAPASCATATVVAALEAASATVPLAGASVLITGAGMLGLTATAMATDAGATVIVSDPDPERRKAALTFGAAAVADPGVAVRFPLSLASVLQKFQERGAAEVLVALELSGATPAVATAIDAVGVGGVVVLVGSVSPGEPVALDPESLVRRLVTLRGVHNYAPAHLERAAVYLAGAWRRYPFVGLVGETFPLEKVDEAITVAASGRHPRVAVAP